MLLLQRDKAQTNPFSLCAYCRFHQLADTFFYVLAALWSFFFAAAAADVIGTRVITGHLSACATVFGGLGRHAWMGQSAPVALWADPTCCRAMSPTRPPPPPHSLACREGPRPRLQSSTTAPAVRRHDCMSPGAVVPLSCSGHWAMRKCAEPAVAKAAPPPEGT